MSLPKISVVTPSYNQAQFLAATMASIHDQGYPHLEHIVMDGGSSDGSQAIIESYSGRLAYWQSEPDGGQTNALRMGFERATGDVFCWLNSDDLFLPHTLRQVGEYFAAHPEVSFVYGDAIWITAGDRVIKAKREHGFHRFIWLYDHNFIPQPSAFWRSGLYHEVGGVDPSYNLAMDGDLWMRFAERTRPRHVRRFWSKMRFYPDQKNTRMREASLLEIERIRDRYLPPGAVGSSPGKRLAARAARVGLKLVTGGYRPQEVVLHGGTLLGRGTWEQQETKRSG
jgi:glycosyltransferase involved in cell wall biosynthesis